MKKLTKRVVCIVLALSLLCMAGCTEVTIYSENPPAIDKPAETETVVLPKETDAPVKMPIPPTPVKPIESAAPTIIEPAQTEPARRIVIDPGHQDHADTSQEPVGPGATETKMRVTGGTCGTTTGYPEYELNLQVSLLLRDELEKRGYEVIMTRESNDVNLSNVERTTIANEANADAYIRVHANGSTNSADNGLLMINMTPKSPYNPELYPVSRALSEAIGTAVADATGAKNGGIWETNTMSGINWSKVPVTILEMGYMTNPTEELLLVTDKYQQIIALGVADGLDQYFESYKSSAESPARSDSGELSDLEDQLSSELSRLSSEWDVWIEDLNSGASIHCTQNIASGKKMISASLIKLFIMGTVYEEIAQGSIAEERVSEKLRYMITVSDNSAANVLTRLLGNGDAAKGREAVNNWAKAIGCKSVEYNRLMLEDNGLQNYVSAEDCAKILRMIYQGECVSKDCSEQMMGLLKEQYYNSYLPAGVPENTPVAHKTGDLLELCVADVGIVFTPEHDYIICVICNHPISYTAAGSEIGSLSKMVYDYFAQM